MDVIRIAAGFLMTGLGLGYLTCWFVYREAFLAMRGEADESREYAARLIEEPAYYRDQMKTYLGVAAPRVYGRFGRIDYHDPASVEVEADRT